MRTLWLRPRVDLFGPAVAAGLLAALLVWLGPPGTDLAAHVYQRTLFIEHGFVATTIVVNYAFQQRKLALTLIDGFHWLAVLIVQGIELTVRNWRQLSPALDVPLSFPYAAIPLAAAVMTLVVLRRLLRGEAAAQPMVAD